MDSYHSQEVQVVLAVLGQCRREGMSSAQRHNCRVLRISRFSVALDYEGFQPVDDRGCSDDEILQKSCGNLTSDSCCYIDPSYVVNVMV